MVPRNTRSSDRRNITVRKNFVLNFTVPNSQANEHTHKKGRKALFHFFWYRAFLLTLYSLALSLSLSSPLVSVCVSFVAHCLGLSFLFAIDSFFRYSCVAFGWPHQDPFFGLLFRRTSASFLFLFLYIQHHDRRTVLAAYGHCPGLFLFFFFCWSFHKDHKSLQSVGPFHRGHNDGLTFQEFRSSADGAFVGRKYGRWLAIVSC